MIVEELIAELQQMDGKMPVYWVGNYDCVKPLSARDVHTVIQSDEDSHCFCVCSVKTEDANATILAIGEDG